MEAKEKIKKKKGKKPKKKSVFRKVVKVQLWVFFFAFLAILGLLYQKYGTQILVMKKEAAKMVEESSRDTFRAAEPSLVYDVNNKLIKTVKDEKEVYYIDYADIPQQAVQALISIEDKNYYKHKGIDIKANIRAVVGLVVNRGKRTAGGGSTITQQLSRNIFLTTSYSWQRKIQEIFLSWDMEKKYSKEDILEFYLNNVNYANGYYGIQAASNGYFNKSVNSLTLSQIALLTSIPNRPTAYNPRTNLDNALTRRNKILDNMLEDGVITDAEYDEAINEKIKIKDKKTTNKNYVETFVMESATKALMKEQGFKFKYSFKNADDKETYMDSYNEAYENCQKSLYSNGYRIYTSIDLTKQDELQKAVNEKLEVFTNTTEEGLYTLQGAAVCIDNETGLVVSIVGGRQQPELVGYTLNRAYQSYRQPGSTIKPLIVYTPAFQVLGYNPSTIVDDSKMKPEEKGPSDSGGVYLGKIPLRTAVEKSKNVVAWRIYQQLTPKVGMSFLKEMEFAKLDAQDFTNMAPCLGGFYNGVSVLEMASGYAALENDGEYREPSCIVQILDTDGNTVVDSKRESKIVYSVNAARMMTDVLKGVFGSDGTARSIGAVTNMDSAGKTGTTNDYKDGWFCGFTPYYTTAVWVGCDQPKSVNGLQGASYPAQIWKQFMELIHEGLPKKTFHAYVSNEEKQMTATKAETTAEATTVEATTEELTTEEVTEATTEEFIPPEEEVPPTTEAPTTEAPTTEAPTTEQPPDDGGNGENGENPDEEPIPEEEPVE